MQVHPCELLFWVDPVSEQWAGLGEITRAGLDFPMGLGSVRVFGYNTCSDGTWVAFAAVDKKGLFVGFLT